MEYFTICLNAVLPFFITMFIGWLAVRIGWVDGRFVSGLNNLVFRILIPCVLFMSVYEADLSGAFDLVLFGYCVGATVAAYLVLWLLGSRFLDKKRLSSFVQACYRGNYVIFATPLAAVLLAAEAQTTVALMTPFIVATYSILAAVIFTVNGSGGEESGLKRVGAVLLGVVKTPFVIGIFLGLAVNLLSIRLPVIVEQPVQYMAQMGTPAALLGIGGALSAEKIRENVKLSVIAVSVKNILLPLAMLLPAILLGFRGTSLAVIALTGLAPTALNSFTTARNMGGDADLAASCVMLSTISSLATIVLGLTILLNMGLF